MVERVPEEINFVKEEEKVLAFWKDIKAFETSLQQSKGRPRYTFYDGPPFATGLPHYGHILAGTIKDTVTRYAHQQGFHVERRFGWDTHGLPVEFEIDKTLGITGPDDVAKMGIAAYNAECRKIVMRYSKEWEMVVGRLGRWIDFENDYKTLYPEFMESVWWVFKQLFDKGLVYRGCKVMPFSTACNTPLSNFESGQNYKDIVDPAVYVSFPLDEDPSVSMLAWTTTPWTLPSNLALCVNPAMDYVRVRDKATAKRYILLEARLEALEKATKFEYEVEERFKGDTLKDKTYLPLFPYYAEMKSKGAFRVLCDGYVTADSGTGVVHQAPYFGEDDYRVCLAAGVIRRGQDMICPVDASGRFLQPVADFVGQYVKEADKNITKMLKEGGRMVHAGTEKHAYPFCWRSDTPLIYRAVPSWFIRVEQMSQQLLENNAKTYWVPENVKEKRFANWLRDARDWAFSRSRYWGTPIPIWMSDDGVETVCVGSIEELHRLSGVRLTDLHREHVDQVTIPSRRPGQPPLRRIAEVFDCWFESGAMPYAQVHYPFEKRREFEDNFPADFIAEGIDQTRGWFYTLLVLSTALFGKPPFKNLIVNGLVLAADGQKMSKSKKNYPDPMTVVNKYGADALRLYLINSPVVKAENLRFKEDGVRDIIKDVFLPWYNAYRFFMQNLERLQREEGVAFVGDDGASVRDQDANVMDRWIVSFTQSLLVFVAEEMAAYRLYTVVPRLVRFVDNLTNWYVRMNRKRLKGDTGADDCQRALQTLFHVLYAMVRVMAPFTPFLTELMYRNLRHLVAAGEAGGAGATAESVHFVAAPRPLPALIDAGVEAAVARLQAVVELGRVARDRRTKPVKIPLLELVVVHRDPAVLSALAAMQRYLLEELNVRRLTLTSDKKAYGVTLKAEPDHKTLGLRLKNAFKPVTAAIKQLTDAQLQPFVAAGDDAVLDVLGHRLTAGDLRIFYEFTGERADELRHRYEAGSNSEFLVLLDVSHDQAMVDEGVAREVINRIQKLRKAAKLVPTDPVTVFYQVTPEDGYLAGVVRQFDEYVASAVKVPWRPASAAALHRGAVLKTSTETFKDKADRLDLTIKQGLAEGASQAKTFGTPSVPFVNVFHGVQKATVLLANPVGENVVASHAALAAQAAHVLGLRGRGALRLYDAATGLAVDDDGRQVKSLNGATLQVVRVASEAAPPASPEAAAAAAGACCPFVDLVSEDGRRATLLLENPLGRATFGDDEQRDRLARHVLAAPDASLRFL